MGKLLDDTLIMACLRASLPKDMLLTDCLKMWKDSGIPAPLNELQSIQNWMKFLEEHGAEDTLDTMRKRMLLLGETAYALNAKGPKAEAKVGIYDNRPDLRSKTARVSMQYTNHRDETSVRLIIPSFIWFGTTPYHTNPQPQWMLNAWDVNKEGERDFALRGILCFN